MRPGDSVYSESSWYAFYKTIFVPSLRKAFFIGVPSIFYNFFYSQWKAAFFSGRIPVSNADHPLDKKIPFVPAWVTIYIDFVNLWIRMLTFFIRRYKRKAYKPLADYIVSIGNLYAYAAQIYKKNLSTTKRPFYIARPRFLVIHALDPHLMCIPSLHVMVVIHSYTKFAEISRQMGDEEKLIEQFEEMKQGALAISQAILFVKQHSVNCIPAALYAMTCYSPDLFPPEEAKKFTEALFSPPPKCDYIPPKKIHPTYAPNTKLPETDVAEIKEHIMQLYYRFLEEGKTANFWGEPLLKFLRDMR